MGDKAPGPIRREVKKREVSGRNFEPISES
jgi:hypothetical protein